MDKTIKKHDVMSFEIFQQECLVSPYYRPAFFFDCDICDHHLKGLNEFQGDDQISAGFPKVEGYTKCRTRSILIRPSEQVVTGRVQL